MTLTKCDVADLCKKRLARPGDRLLPAQVPVRGQLRRGGVALLLWLAFAIPAAAQTPRDLGRFHSKS